MLAGPCEVPLLSLQGSASVIHVIEGTTLTAQSQSNAKEAREHHTEGKTPREGLGCGGEGGEQPPQGVHVLMWNLLALVPACHKAGRGVKGLQGAMGISAGCCGEVQIRFVADFLP